MELLLDLFGYLSIILHGATILAQSITMGAIVFLVCLVRPLSPRLQQAGPGIAAGTVKLATWGAAALLLTEAATVALQVAVLIDTVHLDFVNAATAHFAIAGLIKTVVAAILLVLLLTRGTQAPTALLLPVAVLGFAAATLTTHAVARLDERALLLAISWLHQVGAAIWIGGIPSFLMALSRATTPTAIRLIGARFSRISMLGVACILFSGIGLCVHYIGDLWGFYGTAYGVMVSAKITLFLLLLGLGGMNFLLVERLRSNPATSINRLRRFAEVEVGIGVAIFFAAASLTSVPPAIDLTEDRVTWPEIVERYTPAWPRLTSPDHDSLALPALQQKLDQEAAQTRAAPQAAFVPGAGELPPRNAADIAWSEYNHHWAGLFVVAVGLLALLNQAGVGWARHWPLVFLGLAVFLFIRSDPETWPLGDVGFLESFRDVEVLQHRSYVLLIVVFAWFEWRVRTSGRTTGPQVLVFPLLCAAGGLLLLTHSHAIANVKEQLLIEISHTPLALAGIVAGWSRWLELRLDPKTEPVARKIAGWVWPVCILLCGLILLDYWEA